MPLMRRLVIPVYLFLCLILGGASNGGFIANWILQVSGALLLVWAFWSPAEATLGPHRKWVSAFLVLGGALVVWQFVPLSREVWLLSGERATLADEGRMAGVTFSPLMVTLLPFETLKSALWALPALAVGVAMLRRSCWKPDHVAWAVIAAMVLSVILGSVQLAQGQQSPAYLYDITNRGSTVGFFANSNHLANLLLVSIPFIGALVSQQRQRLEGVAHPFFVLAAGLLGIALAGIAVNGSLAGFGLVGPVLIASLAAFFAPPRLRRITLVAIPAAILAAMGWLLSSGRGQQLLVIEDAPSMGGRQYIWDHTLAGATDFWPLGSGLGTFAEVFQRYEDPAAVSELYINHTHNDYLELILEFGLPVLPLMGAFLVWWCFRSGKVWLARVADPHARAAVIATATILVHSTVDYPLRTAAMSSIFVAAVVMMALWVTGDGLLRLSFRRWAEEDSEQP